MSKNKKENVNRKGLYQSFIIILAIFIILFTIFDNTGDRVLIKEEKNTVLKYIYKKYKIKPKIVSSNVDKACEQSSFLNFTCEDTYYGVIYILKYKNKKFRVYVPYSYSTTSFDYPKDDYQLDEIRQEFVKQISKIIGATPYDFNVNFVNDNGNFADDSNLFRDYYDGKNIENLIKNYDEIRFTFKYINNVDLLNVSEFGSFSKKMLGTFVQFNSLEDFKENKKYQDSSLYDYGDPLFIKDVLKFSYGKVESYYNYGNIKKLSLPYVIEGTHAYEAFKKSNGFISKSNNKSIININDNPALISPIYIVDFPDDKLLRNDNNNIYIYLKKEEIENFKENELSQYKIAQISFINDNKKISYYQTFEEIGDYLRLRFHYDSNIDKLQIVLIKPSSSVQD